MTRAAIGSAVFFAIAPVMVAGVVPWWISHWQTDTYLLDWPPLEVMGGLLIAGGGAALVECFARFARKGLGTPAPAMPARRLVVSGLYRYVRNPMYVAVAAVVVGQALLFGNLRLVEYGAAVWLCCHLFVVLYEEPALGRRFGDEYESYRRSVPRWIPVMPGGTRRVDGRKAGGR